MSVLVLFFFKQTTAYEMLISDWSSDVCSSDLTAPAAASARPASRIRKPRRRRPRWVLGWRCMSKLLFVPADAERGVLPGKRRTAPEHRSEERRVGKEWVSTCRSRW